MPGVWGAQGRTRPVLPGWIGKGCQHIELWNQTLKGKSTRGAEQRDILDRGNSKSKAMPR